MFLVSSFFISSAKIFKDWVGVLSTIHWDLMPVLEGLGVTKPSVQKSWPQILGLNLEMGHLMKAALRTIENE